MSNLIIRHHGLFGRWFVRLYSKKKAGLSAGFVMLL
ncbi:hypothetical protein N399_23455 [Bacillus licheniformis CG-B52]|nr:hypothetical protein N399_23455 [Bacillus licheniformis CG-B52]